MSEQNISKEDFCARFKAQMIKRAGPTFGDGGSVAEYADEVSGTYYDTDWQREEGPEDCANADMDEWE